MEKQLIDLRGTQLTGRILDIGGGGEGVISRHAGEGVIAIDRLKEELEESPDIGLKIVMDATDMKFLDNTFDNATCFYSLMFMGKQTAEKCLSEAYRVLKPGGYLWIWDTAMPNKAAKDIFIVQLDVTLEKEEISTGYGIRWNRGQTANDLYDFCTAVGFTKINCELNGEKIFIKMQK